MLFVPIYAFIALLMISEIDYSKLASNIVKKGKVATMIAIVAIILMLFYFQMWAVLFCSGAYILFGIVREIYRIIAGKPKAA
jgi:phosphatidylserine synthase